MTTIELSDSLLEIEMLAERAEVLGQDLTDDVFAGREHLAVKEMFLQQHNRNLIKSTMLYEIIVDIVDKVKELGKKVD